jgi:type II secretory pathway pseudopilin PulG
MIILNFKFKILNSEEGFSLAELVLALGILSIIFGFIIINLGRVTRTTSVLTSAEVLISDLRIQQEKAMNGVNSDTSSSSFGIFFEEDQYTLFTGSVYSASDPANAVVVLPENITISNTAFPQDTIVFDARSGEVNAYSESQNSVTLSNSMGIEQKTVTVNKYGVAEELN